MKTFTFIPLDILRLGYFSPKHSYSLKPWETPAPDLGEAGSEGPEVRKQKWGRMGSWAWEPGNLNLSELELEKCPDVVAGPSP